MAKKTINAILLEQIEAARTTGAVDAKKAARFCEKPVLDFATGFGKFMQRLDTDSHQGEILYKNPYDGKKKEWVNLKVLLKEYIIHEYGID